MKLCDDQKIIMILAISAIWIILCLFFYIARVIPTLAIFVALLALLVAWAVQSLLYLFKIRRQRKEKQLRKLNNEVFKKWKEVSVVYDRFHVEYTFETMMEKSAYEQGRRFLESSKETREICELWDRLDSLKVKLNNLGNRIDEEVKAVFSVHYPSLKKLPEFSDSFHDGCYVANNIVRLVNKVALRFVSNEEIDWKGLLRIESYTDTPEPTFRLVNHGVLIHSRDQNDVDKSRFQSAMKKLKPRIISDMKQVTELYNDINRDVDVFKRRMNELRYA